MPGICADAVKATTWYSGDYVDVATSALDLRFPNDTGRRVVPPLDQDVGEKRLDEPERRVLVEEHDVVHARERRHHRGARLLPLDGSIGALDRAHRAVRIKTDEEVMPQAPRPAQELR